MKVHIIHLKMGNEVTGMQLGVQLGVECTTPSLKNKSLKSQGFSLYFIDSLAKIIDANRRLQRVYQRLIMF